MSTSNSPSEQHTTLPTFRSGNGQRSSQLSYAESSNASSRMSATGHSNTRSNHDSDKEDQPTDKLSIGNNVFVQQENRPFSGNAIIKRPKRSSGGFLLDSSPDSSRLSRSILSHKSIKGKEKPEVKILSVQRRRGQTDGAESGSSARGSPMSTEVKSSPLINGHGQPSKHSQHGPGSQEMSDSLRSHISFASQQNSSPGFDTDPAQIVEMALRLNEGRRRQAFANRYVSAGMESRRIVSKATSRSVRSSPPQRSEQQGGSLPREFKRMSLNPGPVTPQKMSQGHGPKATQASPSILESWSPEQDVATEDSAQISRATQNRVAKAKAYFELAYEHRRLLSQLPPIRNPNIASDPRKPGYASKVYNPLQYARNRKLRFRERAPINSQDDGWHDIQKVRDWVDAIVNNSNPGKGHDPLERIRLPPLVLAEDDENEDEHKVDAGTRRSVEPGKPRRPKSDWVTHPGDLIADAFWTEQGLNKQKIYNRDNEPIFPPGTNFQFSGWRNHTPVKVPDELKQSSSSPEFSPTTYAKRAVAAPPDLPKFESTHKDHSWTRTKSKFGKSLKKDPRSKKHNDHDIFDTSSESSGSVDDTEGERAGWGRKRLSKRRDRLELPDGDPFAPPVRDADPTNDTQSSKGISAKHDSPRESTEHGRSLRYLRHDDVPAGALNNENDKHKLHKRRKLLDTIRLDSEDKARSSVEYDSTAPATPTTEGFPSIAINLSPPDSRSPSPMQKARPSFFGAVKDKMHTQKDRVERHDFAKQQSSNEGSQRGSISYSKTRSHDLSRSTSPMSRGTSPFSRQQTRTSMDEHPAPNLEPREGTISKVSTRTTDSGTHRSHRVRGFFKGGRIAEIVGGEVSRVGDFIWKKDPPKSEALANGSTSGYDSDSDELTDSQEKSAKLARTLDHQELLSNSHPTASLNKASPTRTSPKSVLRKIDAPQYHFQGLPSFTSPFQKDREAQGRRKMPQSPGGTQQNSDNDGYDSDPVSTAAAARRAIGKSPRLGHLAPPKLDTNATTPDGRRSSYGFSEAFDLKRTKSASQLYNGAIDERLQASRSGKRLASSSFANPFEFGSTRDRRQSSTIGNSQSPSRPAKTITMHDLFRTRALLLATAIKATNIVSYCDAIPKPQSAFLFSAFRTTGASGYEMSTHLPASRKQEHVIAARHVVGHLNEQSSTFNDALEDFTRTTIQNLHREIQVLEDEAENELFPRLQSLSDQAGQLAQKLTTTSTLAVKSVNDEVAEAVRMKRRGPHRIGSILGYKLIEWGVVSILWLIWFMVTTTRFLVGAVKTICTAGAWLLWLR